jgi:hypothetical protein
MAMMVNQEVPVAASVYGRKLGIKFGAEDAPFILTRSLQCADIAVTEVFVDRPLGRLCDPLPRMNAYMICLLLHDLPDNSYWEEGRQVSVLSLQAGQTTIHDLRREPLALMDKPVHSLLFYLPCAALDALADQANVPRVSELRYEPGLGICDERSGISALRFCLRFALPIAPVDCLQITSPWHSQLMPRKATAECRRSRDRSRAGLRHGRKTDRRK